MNGVAPGAAMINVRHHWDIWKTAWAEAVETGPGRIRRRRELEFLPAVQEVEDTPPSPLGRAVLGTILAFFCVAILWAMLGRIDIVSVARGKLIPSGKSKVIQPLEAGVVKMIHVRDGQLVRKGEPLVELDTTVTEADRQRWSNEVQAAQVEGARLKALLAGEDTLVAPPGADPQYVALQQQLLQEQLTQHKATLAAMKLRVEQRKADIQAKRADIARLEATVPMQAQRAQAFKKLLDDHYVSEMQYLDAEQQRIDKVQELEAKRQELIRDEAELAETWKHYQRLIAEFMQSHQTELAAIETKAASLSQELVKAGQRRGLQTLMAPIDGVVQQLAIHTVGGVVTPAQQLMVVVPREHQLEVEAIVENKDIGFVRAGQPAEIKIDSFPFTIYGVIDGHILSVSNDAVPLEQAGLVYTARVGMARSDMQIDDRVIHLSPGMAVTVEIKTGTRRAIEFFLSPLLKAMKETARER